MNQTEFETYEVEEAYRKLYQVLTQLRLARQSTHDLHIESALGNQYNFLFENDKKEFVELVGKTYEDLNRTINRIKKYKLNH